MQRLLNKALLQNEMELSEQAKQKLIRYLELILQWNRVFNLTTILQPEEMVYLHLIDSLVVSPYLKGQRFLDVGSGAGLPGIPLAILHPEQEWVLLDKNSKKTRFLTQVVAELGLNQVEIVHSRSQDFHSGRCFDTILSRAFGTISLFLETTQHLLCPKGQFLALKGKYPEEELAAIGRHFSVEATTRLAIKGMDIERHVVCLRIKS